jgi:hypothetical protein
VEGFAVAEVWNDYKLARGQERGKVTRHLDREQSVSFAVDKEYGRGAAGKRFVCSPDGRNEWQEKSGKAAGARACAKRGAGSAEDEAVRRDAVDDSGGDAGAHGEAEDRDWHRSDKALKRFEGGNGVVFPLRPVGDAGAAAVAGVIEDHRGRAVLREEALHGEPLVDDFANAVAKKD